MRELITTFGETREAKISNKEVAIDLSNARVDLVKIFKNHKPNTYKEKSYMGKITNCNRASI